MTPPPTTPKRIDTNPPPIEKLELIELDYNTISGSINVTGWNKMVEKINEIIDALEEEQHEK